MMTTHQQIIKAIGAHALWKSRLEKVITQGISDTSVTVVRQDNQCDFGRWMHGPDLPEGEKRSTHFKECLHLHRQFHLAAAKIMTLALANRKDEASRALAPMSEFANSSASLTKAMMEWDKEVTQPPAGSGQH